MWQSGFKNPRILVPASLALALLLIIACGGAAPAATPTPESVAAPTPTPATAVEAATPTPAPGPAAPTAGTLTDKSLRLAITPLPQDSYIPWLVTSSGFLPYRPMMETLTSVDPSTGVMEIYPQLATEWELSPDAMTYTFKLRQGVPFHFDWGEYTAADFIKNVDHAMSPDSITGCRSTFRSFMGADSATQMMEMGNLQVIDDYTITMHLARPQVDVISWWLNDMTYIVCAPGWSSAQFEAEGEAMFERGPAGTGPYQFVRRVLKDYTEMERVPYNHWRVDPEFKTLRITTTPEDLTRLAMLLTGEADMVDIPKVLHDQAVDAGMTVLESALPDAGLTIMPYGQYYVSQVNWKPDQDPWAAPGETGILVRKALNHAMNREQLINVLFRGLGEPMYNTIHHPSLEGWNPRWEEEFAEQYRYDPELAKQLLDQAGYPGVDGQRRFRVEMGVSSLPGLPETIEVAQAYGQMLEEIGIEVTYTEAEFARFLDAFRDRHDAHFFLPTRVTIRPISANMRIYYYTGPTDPQAGRPTGGVAYMEDPLFDEVYEALLVETDPAERNRLSQMAGDKVFDDYRTIPLVWVNSTLVVNPDVVEEYIFGSITGIFGHLEYARAAQ